MKGRKVGWHMRHNLGVFSFLLVGGILCAAQDLPVRKVVLYKNGLGFFEHTGQVSGNQMVEIVLPSRQLDDVLKSLTVIDRGRGAIAGITYDSAESLDRRLSELPVKVDPSAGLVDFLNKIPGAEIEITVAGVPVAGRLMGAEIRQKKSGEYVIGQSVQANILTARGEVRSFELSSAVSVKLMKADLAAELREYLTVLDSGHQRDARRLKIQANGTGERPLLVSYTAEAPIWKTTYRLVLDASHKPLLQGWAIVDNTTANEWNDVQLSLVAGMPVSFIQNLSQPLYGRRPVVPMGQGFAVTPQVHQATLETPTGQGVAGTVFDPTQALVPNATVSVLDASGQVLKQVRSGTDGSFNVNLEIGTYRLKVERPGFRTFTANNLVVNPGRLTAFNPTLNVGVVSESVDVMASAERVNTSVARLAPGVRPASAPPSPPPTMSEIMRESAPETAQAQPVGDQFEYKLRQPVTIHRSQSALLPIVNAEIDGEKVVLYSESTGDRRPRFAVWLKNSSGLTLDAGSFSVIDTDAFAGEGLTETIHPGERRLLSYALDSGLEISSNRENERSRVERVAIAHGVMTLTRQVRDKKVYVIRNNDDKPRTLVVEHPVRAGWKLAETQEPAESSTAYYRFRVDARPKATTEFVVREVSQSPATYAISNVDSDTVAVWIKENTIDAEMEKSLREILRLRAIVADLRNKDSQLEAEDEKINESQTRLRDNLGKLNSGNKDEASLRLRYVKQMEQQEDRLAQIKTEQEKLEPQIEGAQKKLDDYIESIAFDKKL